MSFFGLSIFSFCSILSIIFAYTIVNRLIMPYINSAFYYLISFMPVLNNLFVFFCIHGFVVSAIYEFTYIFLLILFNILTIDVLKFSMIITDVLYQTLMMGSVRYFIHYYST